MAPAPLPFAAAASSLAAVLSAHATGPRSDAPQVGIWAILATPPQVGIRGLLSALQPYIATTSGFVFDAAAAKRVTTSSAAGLVRDLLDSRAALLHASAGPLDAAAVLTSSSAAGLAGELLATRAALLHASAGPLGAAAVVTASSRAWLVGEPRAVLLHAVDASAGPLDGAAAATSTCGALVGLSLPLLLNDMYPAPRAVDASAGLLDGAAAATSTRGAPLGLRLPFLLNDVRPAPRLALRNNALVRLNAPSAGIRASSLRPVSGAWSQRGCTALHPLISRSFSTATPERFGARAFRAVNNCMKGESAKIRRQVGALRIPREGRAVDSLDYLLRDLGYFTRGAFARYLGLFTVLTVMSEGVRECRIRFRQLSTALRRVTEGESMRWLRENGEIKEEIMVGDNFSWLFD